MTGHLAAVLTVLGLAAPGTAAALPCRGDHWVGAWATSPSNAGPAFLDQTLRLIVTPTIAGRHVRVRLSNRFGAGDVTFTSAFVARRRKGAALVPATSRRLRFDGRNSVGLAPGAEVVSDPIRLRFRAFDDLAVSVHVEGSAAGASQHLLALQTSYATSRGSGDHAAEPSASAFTQEMRSWPYLTDVEVRAPRQVGAVVTLGDSITEGFPGPVDANSRYSDFLARRLAAAAGPPMAVQNAGISSNRLLGDFPRPYAGPSMLHRLRADVLDQAGASTVVVMAGTNDIGQSPPPAAAGARAVIAGLRSLVVRLRHAGLRVILGTQTPAESAVSKRNQINRWIRRQPLADGVADIHAALRDPRRPNRLLPAYDSGDHLHPSVAGFRAMARAVPLGLLRRNTCGSLSRLDRS